MSSPSEGALLGMGNPLLDISAVVTTEYLEKYGLDANNQILAEEKHMPMYAEIPAQFTAEYIAGGATQNSIRVAQWLVGATPCSSYIGAVGNDDYAKTLKAEAEASGVHVEYMVDESVPTGTCDVLVTGNDRSLVANISAANNYKEEHLTTTGWPLVEKAKIYYIAGFFITVSPPSIMKVAEHAAAANKIFTMNLSAPFICQFFKDPLFAALPYVDILFGNETEFAEFAKSKELGTEDLTEIAIKTSMLPKVNTARARVVIITQGMEPTIIATGGWVKEYPIVPCDKSLIVDTNGAGDAWVGGFLAGLLKGKPIDECVKVAAYAAKVIICRSGCTMPAQPDIFEL